MEDKKIEMIQSAKMAELGTLTAMIVHELKQPLFGIKSFSEMLLKEEMDEKKRKKLEMILLQAKRMEDMLKRIREFARKSHRVKEPVSIKEVLEGVKDLISYRLRKGSIKFVEDIPDVLPLVNGNRNHFEQVFLNLLDNALDAVEDEEIKLIGVKGVEGENEVVVYVFDNGKGVSEDAKDRIFEMFYTTKRLDKGTGLGLTICKEIMNMYGGEILLAERIPEGVKEYNPVTVFILRFKKVE